MAGWGPSHVTRSEGKAETALVCCKLIYHGSCRVVKQQHIRLHASCNLKQTAGRCEYIWWLIACVYLFLPGVQQAMHQEQPQLLMICHP